MIFRCASLLAIVLCTACSSQLIKTDRGFVAPQAIGVSAQDDSGIRVTLRHRIVPNGPGSWVRDAPWDEFVLTIENRGTSTVTLVDAVLADSTETLQSKPDVAGASTPTRAAAVALSGAGVAAVVSMSTTTSLAVIGAAGVAGLLILPFALGTNAYVDNKDADRQAVLGEVGRLSIAVPRTLSPEESARGSLFFPATPDARLLVLRHERERIRGEVRLAFGERGATPAVAAAPRPSMAGARVSIQVLESIVPGGRGSLAPNVPWSEYRLVLKNDTDRPVTVKAITRDCRLHPSDSHTLDMTDLWNSTYRNGQLYDESANPRDPFEYDRGKMPSGILVGGETARRSVQFRLDRAGLRLPLGIAARGEIEGSGFFPACAAPVMLRVLYSENGVDREAERVFAGVVLQPADKKPRLVGGAEPGDFRQAGEPLRNRVSARLWMQVGPEGRVTRVEVVGPVNAGPLHDKAAKALAARWQFDAGPPDRTYTADVLLGLKRQ